MSSHAPEIEYARIGIVDTAAPALTATPTPRPGIAAPDTGSGTSGSGDPANPALVAALVAGSITLAATGMLRLRRR